MESLLPHDVLFYCCRLVIDDACRSDGAPVTIARLALACRDMQACLLYNDRALDRLRERCLRQRIERLVCRIGPTRRPLYTCWWNYIVAPGVPRQWQVSVAEPRLVAFSLDDKQMTEMIYDWLVRLDLAPSDIHDILARLDQDVNLAPMSALMIRITTERAIIELILKGRMARTVSVHARRRFDSEPVEVACHLVGALLYVCYPTLRARHEALSRHGRW